MNDKPPFFVSKIRPVFSINRKYIDGCDGCPNQIFCGNSRLLILGHNSEHCFYLPIEPCKLFYFKTRAVVLGWGNAIELMDWVSSQKKLCHTHRQVYHTLPYASKVVGVCCKCLSEAREKTPSEVIYAVRSEMNG